MITRHNFLLLDSSPQSSSYMVDLIRHFRYGVDCVSSVEGALRRLERYAYLGLILDNQSIAKPSAHLLDWLQSRHKDISIILISSGSDDHHHQFIDIIDCGMVVQIIKKPVQPTVLREGLYSAVRQSGSRGMEQDKTQAFKFAPLPGTSNRAN